MSQLTTHVLDNSQGKPAAGLALALYRLADGQKQRLASATTNNDGRCDAPLLRGDAFQSGVYELDFHVGDYFKAQGANLSDPPFLDVVTIRFGIADPSRHYHVPLLVTPWAYSTYRGS